jgi:hypothetical protein
MNFRQEKDNFRLARFYSPEPESIGALVSTLFTSDQFVMVEHNISAARAYEGECRGWPVNHMHIMVYSRLHMRGLENLIKAWARKQSSFRLHMFRTVNPVR